MVAEVREDCPDLREVVFLGDPEWERLMDTGRAADRGLLAEREALLSADDPINIQYTSGTTGFPKGATLTHHNLLNNGFFVGEGCGYTEADRVCIPVPFYHCFGMGMGNLGCTSHGATMVIPAPGFDPALTLRAVQEERCTSLYGVPTMFIAELGLPDFADYDLSSLRTGIMAGSPCPVEVMKRVVDEVRPEAPALREVVFLGDPEWEQLMATGRAADRGRLAERAARPASISCSHSGSPRNTTSRRSGQSSRTSATIAR